MMHLRFLQAALLCGVGAATLAVARTTGIDIGVVQLAIPAVAAAGLALCSAWYRANPARAEGEVAEGHAALAIPGAIVTLLGSLGLGSGAETAAPALVIGALAVSMAVLVLIKRAVSRPDAVRRVVSTTTLPDGTEVIRIDYRLDGTNRDL